MITAQTSPVSLSKTTLDKTAENGMQSFID